MNLSAKTIGISAGVLVFMVISYFIISGTFNIAHYFNTNILFRQITDWCSWENGGYIALFILLYLGALIGLVLILGHHDNLADTLEDSPGMYPLLYVAYLTSAGYSFCCFNSGINMEIIGMIYSFILLLMFICIFVFSENFGISILMLLLATFMIFMGVTSWILIPLFLLGGIVIALLSKF